MAIGPGIPGAVMEAFAEGFACGQVGTLTVTIDDGDGNNIVGPTTANIVEIECGDDDFAVYRYLGVFPSDASLSPYVITWEGPSATDPGVDTTATEEILVSEDAPAPVSDAGPCSPWIEAADVADCCEVELSSDTEADLEDAAANASLILYQVTGRIFSGLCGPLTVRPCRDSCTCFAPQRLAYVGAGGSRLIWTGANWSHSSGTTLCGCSCLSRIPLSGYPVQAIAQVKIDGSVVAPSSYRLDENRYLTRKDGEYWPACQDLSRDDDESGTFSVSYYYGATPPILGQAAAQQLACELYSACTTGECKLPSGATRIVRSGVTIERLQPLAAMLLRGETGLPAIDAFIASYNPARVMRRPSIWSPEGRKYARPVGS